MLNKEMQSIDPSDKKFALHGYISSLLWPIMDLFCVFYVSFGSF